MTQEASNVVEFPAVAVMELTPELVRRLDALEVANTAAQETFRVAYTAHTEVMVDLENTKKALWDNMAIQFNLDKSKPYNIEKRDGKVVLVEVKLPAPQAEPGEVH